MSAERVCTAGVMGWPVAHSKSPLIHRFWLQRLGVDGDYARFPVHPDGLQAALRALPALGISGVNITVPLKVAAIAHMDRLDPLALQVGAVNCVVVAPDGRLAGHNSDVAGFAEPLASRTVAHAVVVGAGGAGRAVLAGLRRIGVRRVTLMNRTVAAAAALIDEMRLTGEAVALSDRVPACDLLVNASSLGMAGQPPLAPDLSALPPHALVYDLVYAPLETALLAAARARGLPTIDGLSMLIGQAAEAFALFYGRRAPRADDALLRARLLAP